MRIAVDSSLLIWLDYFAAEKRLRLAFQSGDIYDYFDVPSSIYNALVAAPSKGRYFNQYIRDSFQSQRLRRLDAT